MNKRFFEDNSIEHLRYQIILMDPIFSKHLPFRIGSDIILYDLVHSNKKIIIKKSLLIIKKLFFYFSRNETKKSLLHQKITFQFMTRTAGTLLQESRNVAIIPNKWTAICMMKTIKSSSYCSPLKIRCLNSGIPMASRTPNMIVKMT